MQETEILAKYGLDGLIVENMHDLPYVQNVGPEILTSMTAACSQVRKVFPKEKPIGVQVLAGANKGAIAVALGADLDFIRAEGFVFGHVADEGWMDAQAGELLRYRNNIGAEHIKIFTDIKVNNFPLSFFLVVRGLKQCRICKVGTRARAHPIF